MENVPLWLQPRSARLAAALVEARVECLGHASLEEALGTFSGVRALSALCGGPDGPAAVGFVARALKRGLRPYRLGVRLDELDVVVGQRSFPLGGPSAQVLPFPGTTSRPDGEPVSLPGRHSSVDGRHLQAAMRLASLVASGELDVVDDAGGLDEELRAAVREPFFGARRLRALVFCAEWVVSGPPADPARLGFALGRLSGDPFGVSLVLFDDTLQRVERMLHGPVRDTAPLFALHRAAARLRDDVVRADPVRVAMRERRFVDRLLAFGPGSDPADAPKLRRRPPATTIRDPETWEPIVVGARARQADLFSP